MRAERLFFLIVIVVCSFALLFYFTGLRKEFQTAVQEKKTQKTAIERLQSELDRVAASDRSIQKTEDVLREQIGSQQEKISSLGATVEKAMQQNKTLTKKLRGAQADLERLSALQKDLSLLQRENEAARSELEDARKKFRLIDPIKAKLADVEKAFESLQVQKGKEDLLQVQLDSLTKELASVNNYLLQILENSRAPIIAPAGPPQPSAPAVDAGALERRIGKLEEELAAAQRERELLRLQYDDAQALLAKNKEELEGRTEKIFSLQEKLMRAENALFDARADYKDKEKEAALLREKYIAVELEKNNLQIAFDKMQAEMAQLQSKFLALLGRIGDVLQTSEDVQVMDEALRRSKAQTGKIDVELFPQTTKGK
ncbi:MAG: hypothetical protein PHT59_05085 [Candidatus Omnitrophica bacterium]|nr:hypothetical protein [Candidatus Omnitrophota bacterium]